MLRALRFKADKLQDAFFFHLSCMEVCKIHIELETVFISK